jgi:hypothetical protein
MMGKIRQNLMMGFWRTVPQKVEWEEGPKR